MSLTKSPKQVIDNGDGTKTVINYCKANNGLYYPRKATRTIIRRKNNRRKGDKYKPRTKPTAPYKTRKDKGLPRKKPYKDRIDKGISRKDGCIKSLMEDKKKVIKPKMRQLNSVVKEIMRNNNWSVEQTEYFLDFMLDIKHENPNELQEKLKLARAMFD